MFEDVPNNTLQAFGLPTAWVAHRFAPLTFSIGHQLESKLTCKFFLK
jgi:hypothetical protein